MRSFPRHLELLCAAMQHTGADPGHPWSSIEHGGFREDPSVGHREVDVPDLAGCLGDPGRSS